MASAVLARSENEGGEASGRAEKRPGAFRTIGEVAEELGVPQHVLRFWESRFAQVRPVKRAGGRRYYRPEDVDLLNGIRRLLHGQGYTIRGAQRVLRQHGVRFVQEVGRGEAVADAPLPAERDPDAGAEAVPASDAANAPDSVLRAVLHDLYACHAALAGLRPGGDRSRTDDCEQA